MDLRTTYPRSIRERVAGYVHLGRMIDKCRAVHAGMQGDYVYPCPMDQRLLQFAGISSESFLHAAHGRTGSSEPPYPTSNRPSKRGMKAS